MNLDRLLSKFNLTNPGLLIIYSESFVFDKLSNKQNCSPHNLWTLSLRTSYSWCFLHVQYTQVSVIFNNFSHVSDRQSSLCINFKIHIFNTAQSSKPYLMLSGFLNRGRTFRSGRIIMCIVHKFLHGLPCVSARVLPNVLFSFFLRPSLSTMARVHKFILIYVVFLIFVHVLLVCCWHFVLSWNLTSAEWHTLLIVSSLFTLSTDFSWYDVFIRLSISPLDERVAAVAWLAARHVTARSRGVIGRPAQCRAPRRLQFNQIITACLGIYHPVSLPMYVQRM